MSPRWRAPWRRGSRDALVGHNLLMRVDLLIMFGAFVAASALAGALGAINLGTALAFGQIAFALAAVVVIVRRP
jgi:hypothetical protein